MAVGSHGSAALFMPIYGDAAQLRLNLDFLRFGICHRKFHSIYSDYFILLLSVFCACPNADPSPSLSFYYTTYEGMCDPSQIDDPVIKEALEEQIRSFGQTPPQLLTTPHPARNSIQHVLNANIKNLNGQWFLYLFILFSFTQRTLKRVTIVKLSNYLTLSRVNLI